MNNQMTIRQEKMNLVMNLNAVVRLPLEKLSQYYGDVLGRKINVNQTLHLLNAQAAFLLTVFPDCTAPVKAVCLTWFVAAVLKCREKL
jgi:hypothetical protein